MSYLAVLPSVDEAFTDACLATMAPEVRERVMVVDNAHGRNIGVSRSWNEGARKVLDGHADWLVIVSACIRFGEPGGEDFVAHLTEDVEIVEAKFVGWHLIAFRRAVFERVGLFDEGFFAYMEDNDFGYRLALSGVPIPWAKPEVDAVCIEVGHALARGVVVDNRLNVERYRRKWGGQPSREAYVHPFDDHSKPLSWWPSPPPLPWEA